MRGWSGPSLSRIPTAEEVDMFANWILSIPQRTSARDEGLSLSPKPGFEVQSVVRGVHNAKISSQQATGPLRNVKQKLVQGTHQEVHDTQEVRSTAIFPCRRFKKVGHGLCIRENRSRIFDEVDSTIRNTDNSPYRLCISSCVAYLLAEHVREYSSPDKGSTTPVCRMAVLCVMP